MRAPLAPVVLLATAVAAQAQATGCTAPAKAAVVEVFVAALLARDPVALGAVLPREGALLLTTTIEDPWLSDAVPARQVAADLADGTGVYSLLIDGGPDDDFADWIEARDATTWDKAGRGQFAPRGDSRTFLRLRCEDGRPVIAEIGWPAA